MSTALDSLCSQAYGARKYHLVGLYAQRAMCILTMCCLPVTIVWLQTEKLLLAMGIDAVVSGYAQHYVYFLIIGMWPTFMFECIRRYLQAQHVMWPSEYLSAFPSAFFPPLSSRLPPAPFPFFLIICNVLWCSGGVSAVRDCGECAHQLPVHLHLRFGLHRSVCESLRPLSHFWPLSLYAVLICCLWFECIV
jgi:hypothetical protein